MLNKVLHALANRPGPFHDPLFGAQRDFTPAVFSADMNHLRDLLYLNDVSTDYYLKRYLALLQAFPDFQRALQDNIVTYCTWEFLPRGVIIEGGDLLSAEVSGKYVEPAEHVLPMNLNYTIEAQSATLAKITAKQHGLVRVVPALASGDTNRPWLRLTWPAEIPFTGPMRLDQPWVAGTRITIEVEPHRFPYAALVQRIQSSDTLSQLLTDAGLLTEFHANQDAMERLALALTVIALSNPAVYGFNPATA